MRLGIMQPYFFPYIGYISLIKNVDKFILLDDVQFIRHGWIERNRILKPTGGWQYISVPLEKHGQKIAIKDIKINNFQQWKSKIISQLTYYKKAPYYRKVMSLVEGLFDKEYSNITELDKAAIEQVLIYLEINTPIEIFRNMKVEIEDAMSADEWALNICRRIDGVNEYWNPKGGKSFFDTEKYKRNGIKLRFQEVEIKEYPQLGSEFEPGLSILDVMMFNDPKEINKMLDRYQIYA